MAPSTGKVKANSISSGGPWLRALTFIYKNGSVVSLGITSTGIFSQQTALITSMTTKARDKERVYFLIKFSKNEGFLLFNFFLP